MWSAMILEIAWHLPWFVGDYLVGKGIDRVLGRSPWNSPENSEPIPDIYGVELLKALMVERDLRRRDLVDIFGTESCCYAVLSQRQDLTLSQIEKLGDRFGISPAVFLRNGAIARHSKSFQIN